MWTIRYVNPPPVADQPSCASSGLNAITMPVPLVCRPPRQVNVCAPVSVTPTEDVSCNRYLPMFGQPVLVFAADADGLRTAWERAGSRPVGLAVFTDELFSTGNDDDNRAAVRAVPAEKLSLAGLAVHGRRNDVDKVVKRLSLHP